MHKAVGPKFFVAGKKIRPRLNEGIRFVDLIGPKVNLSPFDCVPDSPGSSEDGVETSEAERAQGRLATILRSSLPSRISYYK